MDWLKARGVNAYVYTNHLEGFGFSHTAIKRGADQLVKRGLVNVDGAPIGHRRGVWYIERKPGVEC